MITCPNCGARVREGQRFCGNCGTDVESASQRPTQQTPPSQPGFAPASVVRSQQVSPQDDEQSMPYAYSQPSGYDFDTESPRGTPPPARMLVIAGAILLAIICAFACGLLFGFEIIPDLLGMGIGGAASPTKVPVTPTPATLLPYFQLVIA